ncbi:DUF998 domain-containing protein [Actinoplanes sp. NBRC 101535]|uniref:DUF998 domain-containing protein n=1 Tax=Actinoplanes sp. NBRC 101535 TaxID=3032196 RepID=UPI0024A4B536|nr:DUF998 domain-containing protein [Actinoplanes sp. NBRC 101535]GLY07147.1 hypothetical protein Acsp01_75260 [Actinoplanes sp. NBRC 101535]
MNHSRLVSLLAGIGVACVVASLGLYAMLHVVQPSAELDWARRTISQYALLSNGWAFDAATLLLAAGSSAVLVALLRAGVVTLPAVVALVLWILGLVGVVWFEKHNWAAGPSSSGDIHRVASVIAFLSLPAGALLAAWPWLHADRPAGLRSDRAAGSWSDRAAGLRSDRAAGSWSDRAAELRSDRPAGSRSDRAAGSEAGRQGELDADQVAALSAGRSSEVDADRADRFSGLHVGLPARVVAFGGVASLLCFAPILWAVVAEPWTGVRWWRAIPLGGVERLLGLVEVATVLLLAWWAVRATRSAVPEESALAESVQA